MAQSIRIFIVHLDQFIEFTGEEKDTPEFDEENFEEFQKSVRKMPLNSQWKVEGSAQVLS